MDASASAHSLFCVVPPPKRPPFCWKSRRRATELVPMPDACATNAPPLSSTVYFMASAKPLIARAPAMNGAAAPAKVPRPPAILPAPIAVLPADKPPSTPDSPSAAPSPALKPPLNILAAPPSAFKMPPPLPKDDTALAAGDAPPSKPVTAPMMGCTAILTTIVLNAFTM